MAVRARRRQPLARISSRRRRLARLQGVRLRSYQAPRRRVFRRRTNPIQEFPRVDEFQRRFRLTPTLVKELAKDFGSSIACSTRGYRSGGGISHEERVCLALRYLATGANYNVIGDTQGVSRSTVGRAVTEFVAFLYMRRKQHIKFPEGLELHETAVRFGRKYRFPNVVGCVDGTYIPIVKPPREEGLYVCRHGYHALNCMVVTDDRQRFTFVDASKPGSHHDMSVWSQSDFGTKVTNTGRLGKHYLLGDGGYGASAHMLVPFRGAELNNLAKWERAYQTRQTMTRSSVERAIGQLKTRWRCLSKSGSGVIHKDPLSAGWLFHACCVLHNMCLDHGIGELSPKNNQDPQIELDVACTAANKYLEALNEVLPEQLENARKARGGRQARDTHYQEGMTRRAEVMHQFFGGPDPRRCQKAKARQYQKVSRAKKQS